MNELLLLLVSLCFVEFIHNLLEVWGMRQKVEWLRLSLDGKKHGKWPININTKLKTIILHTLILIITGGVGFVILKLINFSDKDLIILGILILLANYIVMTWTVDKFHSEIGRLIRIGKKVKN